MTRLARAVLLVGLALFAAPLGAAAQPATRILRIGRLWLDAPPSGPSVALEGGGSERVPQFVLLRADEVIQ